MKFPFEDIPRLANRAEVIDTAPIDVYVVSMLSTLCCAQEKLRLRKLICKEIGIIREGTKS